MSNVKLALLSVIVLIYGAGWYAYASSIKKNVVVHLLEKSSASEFVDLTYDDISVGGFPFTVDVRVSNIKGKIRTGALLQDIFKSGSIAGTNGLAMKAAASPFANWEVDNFSIESVVFSVNAKADSFSYAIEGDTHYEMNIDGQKFPMTMSSDTLKIEYAFSKSLVFDSSDDRDFLNDIEHVKLDVVNSVIIDSESKEILHRVDREIVAFDVTRDETGRGVVDFRAEMKNSEYTKVSDVFFQRFFDVSSMKKLLRGAPTIKANYSRMGKMNMDVHLQYKGALSKASFATNRSVELVIPKFNYSDASLETNFSGDMGLVMGAVIPSKMSIKWQSDSTVNELWYQYSLEDIKSIATFLKKMENPMAGNPSGGVVHGGIVGGGIGSVGGVASMLAQPERFLPKLHELGTLTNNVDIEMSPVENSVEIRQFELFVPAYGVKIESNMRGKGGAFDGQGSVTLVNYNALVDSLGAYARKIIAFVEETQKMPIPFIIKPGLEAAVKSLIQQVSGSEGDDAIITVQADRAKHQLKIGNLSLGEAMQLAQQTLMPFLQPAVRLKGQNAPVAPMQRHKGKTSRMGGNVPASAPLSAKNPSNNKVVAPKRAVPAPVKPSNDNNAPASNRAAPLYR